jgi:hypothetical protein
MMGITRSAGIPKRLTTQTQRPLEEKQPSKPNAALPVAGGPR